jgi:hypothetical protein
MVQGTTFNFSIEIIMGLAVVSNELLHRHDETKSVVRELLKTSVQ